MTSRRSTSLRETSLTLKIGSWLEATATGWGVVVLPIVVLLVLAVAGVQVMMT